MTHFLFKKDFSEKNGPQEYSAEELDLHTKQAFMDGYDKGCAEAHKDLRDILKHVEKKVEDVMHLQNQAKNHAVQIAKKTCETIFPKYSKLGASLEIVNIVEDIFTKLHGDSIFHLKCSSLVKNVVEQALLPFKDSLRIDIEGDDTFVGSDILIRFENGLIWRSEVEILEKIQGILDAHKEDVS